MASIRIDSVTVRIDDASITIDTPFYRVTSATMRGSARLSVATSSGRSTASISGGARTQASIGGGPLIR
jgi:hypothetical protein